MKTKSASLVLTAFALVVALAQVACQSPQGSATKAAVACSGCKTVWVKQARTGTAGASDAKGPYTAMTAVGHMKCPDCENRLEAYFKGLSKSTHVCKSCGGSMFHCKGH
jgi:hypothetical protein